jgi:replicative superfamily II helicase
MENVMGKQMQDAFMQTELDTTTSTHSSDSSPSKDLSKDLSQYTHEAVLKYLDKIERVLENSDIDLLESLCDKAAEYIEILENAENFKEGFAEIKRINKDQKIIEYNDFILFKTLEDFYNSFPPNNFYSNSQHEEDFNYGLQVLQDNFEVSILGT